jgi:hypothetical protein
MMCGQNIPCAESLLAALGLIASSSAVWLLVDLRSINPSSADLLLAVLRSIAPFADSLLADLRAIAFSADSLGSNCKSACALHCPAYEYLCKKRNRASRTQICSADLLFVSPAMVQMKEIWETVLEVLNSCRKLENIAECGKKNDENN